MVAIPSKTPFSKETILVVDDDPFVRETTQEFISFLEYQVIACHSAESALTLLRANSDAIQLVLTDEQMPGMSGTRLAEVLSEEIPHMPVIIISGEPQQLLSRRSFPSNVKQTISKPISLKDLDSGLSQIIENSSAALSPVATTAERTPED